MAPPVRCFTCGSVLGNKWDYYFRKCEELGIPIGGLDTENTRKLSPDGKTDNGRLLDEMKITKLCCRAAMLTTVDDSTAR